MDIIAFGVGARKVCWPDGYASVAFLITKMTDTAKHKRLLRGCGWAFPFMRCCWMRVMESLLPTHLLELRVKRYVQACL